jgi:hypothetical protein
MPKSNSICKNPECNKPFYKCATCEDYNLFSWKLICCCPECFQKYVGIEEERRNKEYERLT